MLMDEIYRYMLEEWRERMIDLLDNVKRDINNINIELVKRFYFKDIVFLLGKYLRKKIVKVFIVEINFFLGLSYFFLFCKVVRFLVLCSKLWDLCLFY